MPTKEELDEMEGYFKNLRLPNKVVIEKGSTITDIPKFINTSLVILRQYRGPIHDPVFLRLKKLREIMESEKQEPL